jgi:hypothetical protein
MIPWFIRLVKVKKSERMHHDREGPCDFLILVCEMVIIVARLFLKWVVVEETPGLQLRTTYVLWNAGIWMDRMHTVPQFILRTVVATWHDAYVCCF